jgi:competence protein ComEC
MVSIIAFLSSMPIVLNNFFQLNLLSIVFNLIFVPFVSLILFPLSLLCFAFPFLDTLLSIFIYILESSSLFFSKINAFSFIMGKPSVIVLLLYYVFITYSLIKLCNRQYKPLLLIFILLFINYNIGVLNRYPEVTFIDVGQGDSILIRLPHNEGNILIDTGGKMTYNVEKWEKKNNIFSLGNDVIVSYIKSEGIKHLDYLILTHGDYDHMGEAISIIKNITVKNVVFNKDNINATEKMLINKLKNRNINYSFVQEKDIIRIRN